MADAAVFGLGMLWMPIAAVWGLATGSCCYARGVPSHAAAALLKTADCGLQI